MDQVNIHQAKTQLSRLLERVAVEEEIVIAKSGQPLAKLVPFREVVRRPGGMKTTGAEAVAATMLAYEHTWKRSWRPGTRTKCSVWDKNS